MEHKVTVIGVEGACPFDDVVEHFTSKGGDVILLDPDYVYCTNQILSAVEHAERAFRNGTNRSKTFLTETIMYVSGERQVSLALKKMRPKSDSGKRIAVLFDIDDPEIEKIGLARCNEILEGTPEKASSMGLDKKGMHITFEELALELVALLDIEKV